MGSRSIRTFTVLPHLPPRLQALQKLAYNMWWCWNHEAIALFRRLDPDLFEAVEHSPVKLLGVLEPARLEQLLHDDGFLAHMDRVEEALDSYLTGPTWYQETYGSPTDCRVGYFSAEFGLHESVPIYSGGLGVLAGDHLKSASDLGIPLCGVGLMYREGYFRQYLNVDGWQQERYPENDFFNLPLIPEGRSQKTEDRRQKEGPGPSDFCLLSSDFSPLIVGVSFPGREVFARVWRIQVGRVPLYLLDTNIPKNSAEDAPSPPAFTAATTTCAFARR